MVDNKEIIRAKALEMGFAVAGFAKPQIPDEVANNFRQYLSEARHGDMEWLANTVDLRLHPLEIMPNAQTAIVLGVYYGRIARAIPPGRAGISLHAQTARDYHDVIKSRLKALGRWLGGNLKVFVDTAPVMEKALAVNAGIGWQGRHSCIVSPKFGSWLFLGVIFTELSLEPDVPLDNLCGNCRLCLDACPTSALEWPGQINPQRCIAYLTIENKGEIPKEFHSGIASRIFGCTACLEVCPWNKFGPLKPDPALLPRAELMLPELADLAALNESEFKQIFAGTAFKRLGFERFRRNIEIAIYNDACSS